MPAKKQKANGFIVFTLEWKRKNGKGMTIQQATQEAGKVWEKMDALQRGPYHDKAKEEVVLTNRKMAEKLTCTGMPISQMEKENMDRENKESAIKRDIEMTVNKSVEEGKLTSQSYYFIMANYFTKTLAGGVYVPAEIAVCEFSLKEGVSRIYQTLVNPDVHIYGHQYEAKLHSENTHNLPLPPNALGDKNLGSIYNNILQFIRNDTKNSYAPVYTDNSSLEIVESVLEYLKSDVGANSADIKVYPIQYIFFIMKEATCIAGDIEKPKSFFISDAYFERDSFEYQIGIACQFHEDNDRCKYCTQSYVTRWGFVFADYMCKDIAIPLALGRHCPKNTNLNAIITPAPTADDDTDSFVSMDSVLSRATKPVASSSVFYNNSTYSNSEVDFPSLGAGRNLKKAPTTAPPQRQKQTRNLTDLELDVDYEDAHNPWTARSRNVPRKPDTAHFDIDVTTEDYPETDDFTSASVGHGRSSLNSSIVSSFRRNRTYNP